MITVHNILFAYYVIAVMCFVAGWYIYGALIIFLARFIFKRIEPEKQTFYMLFLYSAVGILALADLPFLAGIAFFALLYETFR